MFLQLFVIITYVRVFFKIYPSTNHITLKNFRLKKKQNERDFVHINTERFGCRSYVGRKGRKQQIIAGGCLDPSTGGSWGKLLHEWMHVLGNRLICF